MHDDDDDDDSGDDDDDGDGDYREEIIFVVKRWPMRREISEVSVLWLCFTVYGTVKFKSMIEQIHPLE